MVDSQVLGPPRIAPVTSAELARPRWSVMIPTYKSSSYLRATLRSVLEQALPPAEMQIEVIDDGSPDDASRRIVDEVGQGRVAFFRKPKNAGLVANFNTCIERARGHYVHILHDDDLVRPGFYETFDKVFEAHPDVGAAFCRYLAIDARDRWTRVGTFHTPETGYLWNPVVALAPTNPIRTPTVVVRRSIYERIGGFDTRLSHTADWEMWVRLAVTTPLWFEDAPLALYREHGSSDTSRLVQRGENIQELRRSVAVFREYLPPDMAGCAALAKLWAGGTALKQAFGFARQRKFSQATANILQGLRCVPAPHTAVAGIRLKLQDRAERRRRAARDAG